MESEKEKVCIDMAMEMSTMAPGKPTSEMVKVCLAIVMDPAMKEIGLMIDSMGMERRSGLMEPYLKANLREDRRVAMGSSFGKVELLMKEIL